MKLTTDELKVILSGPEISAVLLERVLEGTDLIEAFVEDFIEELEENLENNRLFHKRLTREMMSNAHFRRRMIEEVAAHWSDD